METKVQQIICDRRGGVEVSKFDKHETVKKYIILQCDAMYISINLSSHDDNSRQRNSPEMITKKITRNHAHPTVKLVIEAM